MEHLLYPKSLARQEATKLPSNGRGGTCQGLIQWDACCFQGWNATRVLTKEGCLDEVISILQDEVPRDDSRIDVPEEYLVYRKARW